MNDHPSFFSTTFVNLLVLALLGLVSFQLAGIRSRLDRAAVPPVFEYHIQNPPNRELEKCLEGAGKLGWELITARRALNENGHEVSYELIMKRRMQVGE